MKTYIRIENDGEIDVNSFCLLGASSKRDDNTKIGFFGSGLKYAVAILLRSNIPFKVFSGKTEIKIDTIEEKFRDKTFQVIRVNGQKTSLTTDMGPNWESWFAVREIYCNAIDEGGVKLSVSDKTLSEKGKTIIYIQFSDSLKELFSNWNNYFSDKRTDIVIDSAIEQTRVFFGNKENLIVYRKGVRCYSQNIKSLYHYDLGWAQINESRVLESDWNLKYELPKILGKIATREMVRNIFDNYKDTFELSLYWQYACEYNENWLDIIDGRKIVIDKVGGYFLNEIAKGALVLPEIIADSLKAYFGNRIKILGTSDKYGQGIEVEATIKQLEYIEEAREFLAKGGIKISYPIKVYEFIEQSVLGEGRDGEIRLAPRVFFQGKKQIVMTILEELSHLQSGESDETRGFQNFLFEQLVTLLEDKVGVRL